MCARVSLFFIFTVWMSVKQVGMAPVMTGDWNVKTCARGNVKQYVVPMKGSSLLMQ